MLKGVFREFKGVLRGLTEFLGVSGSFKEF